MNDIERLTRLEERYLHLQQHVVQQDKAMLEFADQLARMREELTALRERVARSPEGEAEQEERPPHY